MSLETWATTIGISTTADGTYTTLAEVTDVSGVGTTTEAIEDTPLGQRFSRFTSGKITPKAPTLTLNWLPTDSTHATLFALSKAPAMRFWKITLQGGHTYASAGLLTDFSPGTMATSGHQTGTITIQFSGEPTLTVAGGGA